MRGGEHVHRLSINAFNLWRNPWTGLGDTLHRGDDTVVGLVVGGLSLTWQQVGTLLFVAVALLALWQVARRDDLRGVVMAALVLSIAFFALPTRVHERYLFPALALGALLIFSGRVWPWLYGAISVVFFANVYWLYSEDWSFVTDRVQNPGLGGLADGAGRLPREHPLHRCRHLAPGPADHRRARRSSSGSPSGWRSRHAR